MPAPTISVGVANHGRASRGGARPGTGLASDRANRPRTPTAECERDRMRTVEDRVDRDRHHRRERAPAEHVSEGREHGRLETIVGSWACVDRRQDAEREPDSQESFAATAHRAETHRRGHRYRERQDIRHEPQTHPEVARGQPCRQRATSCEARRLRRADKRGFRVRRTLGCPHRATQSRPVRAPEFPRAFDRVPPLSDRDASACRFGRSDHACHARGRSGRREPDAPR